jgi:hypothetical protein
MREVKYSRVSRWPSGHFNPHDNLIVRYRGRDYELECGAGSSDWVHVYRTKELVHVLSFNRGLGYVALAAYMLERAESPIRPMEELFFQADWQVAEVLGPRGVDLEPRTMRRRLEQYLQY